MGSWSEKSSWKNGTGVNLEGQLDFGHMAVRARAFQMGDKSNENEKLVLRLLFW